MICGFMSGLFGIYYLTYYISTRFFWVAKYIQLSLKNPANITTDKCFVTEFFSQQMEGDSVTDLVVICSFF